MYIKHVRARSGKYYEDPDTVYSGQLKTLQRKLKEHGFAKYKTSSFVRFSEIGVLEVICFRRQKHDVGFLTVHLYASPLCTDSSTVSSAYVERLYRLCKNEKFWWSCADERNIRQSFKEIETTIIDYVLPLFSGFDDTARARELFESQGRLGIDTALYCAYLCAIGRHFESALDYLNTAEQTLERSENIPPDRKNIKRNMIAGWRKALHGKGYDDFIKKLEISTLKKLKLPAETERKFRNLRGYVKADDPEQCTEPSDIIE